MYVQKDKASKITYRDNSLMMKYLPYSAEILAGDNMVDLVN